MLLEYKIYVKEKDKVHNLAGVVVIYKNKILLVKPKKFKNKMRKWSIPKGHIENDNVLKTALDELREESRIKLTRKMLKDSPTDTIVYFKNGIRKELNCFIVKVKNKDINIKLYNNMILGNFLKNETVEAGFFSKKDAEKLIELKQKKLLKYLK